MQANGRFLPRTPDPVGPIRERASSGGRSATSDHRRSAPQDPCVPNHRRCGHSLEESNAVQADACERRTYVTSGCHCTLAAQLPPALPGPWLHRTTGLVVFPAWRGRRGSKTRETHLAPRGLAERLHAHLDHRNMHGYNGLPIGTSSSLSSKTEQGKGRGGATGSGVYPPAHSDGPWARSTRA